MKPSYEELAAMLRETMFQTGGYLCQECGESVNPAYPLEKHASSCRIGELFARLDGPEPAPCECEMCAWLREQRVATE